MLWVRHVYARRANGSDKMFACNQLGSDTFQDIIRYTTVILGPVISIENFIFNDYTSFFIRKLVMLLVQDFLKNFRKF